MPSTAAGARSPAGTRRIPTLALELAGSLGQGGETISQKTQVFMSGVLSQEDGIQLTVCRTVSRAGEVVGEQLLEGGGSRDGSEEPCLRGPRAGCGGCRGVKAQPGSQAGGGVRARLAGQGGSPRKGL